MTPALTSTAHARAILALGLPLIGSHLAQMAIGVTDTIMLGWYGVAPLAAGVLGSTAFFVVFVLGSGFAKAVMPIVSAALGQSDEMQVRRATRMALWLSIGFGVISYPIFWWSGPIFLALGQKPEIAALAQDYLQIAGLGMIPALLVMTLKSYLVALRQAPITLWATLAAVGVNAAMNWALIFGNWGMPELGMRGAAIASVFAQTATVILLALYAAFEPSLRRFHLFQRFWRVDWQAMGRVFRLGWPMGMTGLAESGLFAASAVMMGWVGTVALAAHGITMQIVSLAFMAHVGLSNAATVRIGWAYGAADWRNLRQGAVVAMGLSMAVATLIIAIFLTLPGPMVALFLDPAEPERTAIIALASGLLILAALFQVTDAAQVMALGFLMGIQDTRVPLVIAAVSYWAVGIPASYTLGFYFGLGGYGIWGGLVIGLTVAATLLLTRFWHRAPKPA
jgi:MATE family multidrug resistance protein